ncbi:MAG: conjugal transfer protein TraX [Treponema sp.]|nr:conjugal transfer protein TraX [Treponema sp.]
MKCSGPAPWRVLSGTGIKVAGVILMTADHLHQMFIAQGAPGWLGWFGRPVAAMFLFLCAEGFYYTRDKRRYMLQLLGGFLLMTAMNRILSIAMPMEDVNLINNIFGTLFMAAFYMWILDRFRAGLKEKSPAKILSAIGGFLLPLLVSLALLLALQATNRTAALILMFIPNPLFVEGGFILVFMGTLFYALRNYRIAQAALILAIGAVSWYTASDAGDVQWLMVFAVIPLFLYNGKRGKGGKYFFYIFYPAHIYLLYCAAWFLQGIA